MYKPQKPEWPAWAEFGAVTVIGLALAALGAFMI